MRITTIGTNHFHQHRFALIRLSILCCLTVFYVWSSNAQRPQYTITATLDTAIHTLTGLIDISYTNHSSVSLDKLGIHLWPNAYSSKHTALASQMVGLGDMELYHARPADLGGISALDFSSDDVVIRLRIDTVHSDIAWLELSKPLLPGKTIKLSSPYILKIPESFSRLGVTGNAYQLTQWYPHIAVFDDLGWHMMPYLDQGEFFNDFADYDVRINIPSGYTVAATGVLHSKDQAGANATWHFSAENVIDFAWFASPTFRHQQIPGLVSGDHEVELNIYIDSLQNDLWDSAAIYARRALEFYSEWLGPYPYPQMSIVYCPLSAGGGMEYPMLSQIGYTADAASLDIVIAHEIGHTWLYAILANDERSHPWMDEGLNSFIEQQYISVFQPSYKEVFLPGSFEAPSSMKQIDALQHVTHFNHTLQPPATDPQFQEGLAYFFSAYHLPAQGLQMMMSMLGEDMMKKMFRAYFETHKFSHVSPEDLQTSFESTCACDLTWFFDGWIHHAHEVDYRIKKFNQDKEEMTIVNAGHPSIPLKINTFKGGEPLMEQWINGFKGEKKISLEGKADEVRIYDGFMGINQSRSALIRPRSCIPRIAILPKLEGYRAPIVSLTPVVGKNVADGFMAGVALTSGLVPQQHFKFVLMPMYGFDSKKLRGHATLRYAGDFDQGPFDKFLLSLAFDDFGYNLDTHYLFRDHYVRWEPSVAVRVLPASQHSRITQWWKYRYVHIDQFYGRGVNYEEEIYADEQRSYSVHELLYQMKSDFVLRPFQAMANVQAGKGFVRLNIRYKQHFRGKDKQRGIWIQSYAGWLPIYDDPLANVVFTINGMASNGFFSRDYMYDQWLSGRNAIDGVAAHQVYEKDASLKTLSTIGIGDQWMVGGGFSAALPFKWIHLYMDAALYPSSLTGKTAFSYSGGAALVLMKDVFEIYLPFLESKDILGSLSYEVRDLWFERITFQANFKFFNPVDIVDRLQLGY